MHRNRDGKIVVGLEGAPLVDTLIAVAERNSARDREKTAAATAERPRAPAVSSG